MIGIEITAMAERNAGKRNCTVTKTINYELENSTQGILHTTCGTTIGLQKCEGFGERTLFYLCQCSNLDNEAKSAPKSYSKSFLENQPKSTSCKFTTTFYAISFKTALKNQTEQAPEQYRCSDTKCASIWPKGSHC